MSDFDAPDTVKYLSAPPLFINFADNCGLYARMPPAMMSRARGLIRINLQQPHRKMKLSRILLTFALLFTLPAFALTDEQVVNYIKTQAARGKSEQQIGKELLAKGVTPDQVKRIKAKYDKQQKSGDADARKESQSVGKGTRRRAGVRGQRGQETGIVEEDVTLYEGNDAADRERGGDYEYYDLAQSGSRRNIYGHEIFNGESLTFEPNENIATPQNYRLGPGDEVVIDIWGASEDHLREVITPEGSIMIAQIGPVYLNGMTINDANKHIKSVFAKKYAGVGDVTDINVTLGEIRSIQVDVMGEVSTPGTFRMSPFSSVFHAIYNAGGINDIGSLRNIHVLRNGRRVAEVDIYDFLFKGKQTGNIRLQEGDVIIVPPYSELVSVEGNVKRPMYYELKPTETVADVIEYAGGFAGDAYSEMVRLRRQNGLENELYNIEKGTFSSYRLKDGDVLTIGTVIDRFSNKAEVKGAVNRPGAYAIGNKLSTLVDLLHQADGLSEDAYGERVLIYRQSPDLTLQVIAVNVNDILAGRAADIALERNDIVEVASVQEIIERGAFTITGPVAFPGSYDYAEGTTVQDLIVRAGGLLQGASTARVDVSRRIVDPSSTEPSNRIAEIFTFDIAEGLAKNGANEFLLKPYDIVSVRKSPAYMAQGLVHIDGEVVFTGDYTLSRRNERISDLVQRAGGIMESAYVKGAYLTRQLTEDERAARQEALRIAMLNASSETGDSIDINKIDVSDRYNVGIDLVKALANPGSTYDLVLKPGDRLFVPEEQSTVKISGDVMFPNTVVYEPGKNLKYYINQAGGYGDRAKKRSAFVVYMNGSVSKAGRKTVIEPGCHIIVPSKQPSGDAWPKIMAYATSFGSLATMAATIASLFRR